jgi:hypothetical protein
MSCRYYILFNDNCIKFDKENDYINYVDKNYKILKNSKLLKICGNKIFDPFVINMNHTFTNSTIDNQIYTTYPLICYKKQ